MSQQANYEGPGNYKSPSPPMQVNKIKQAHDVLKIIQEELSTTCIDRYFAAVAENWARGLLDKHPELLGDPGGFRTAFVMWYDEADEYEKKKTSALWSLLESKAWPSK